MLTRTTVIAVALLAGMTVLSAQPAGGRGGGRAGRFKIYPPEAVNRGLQAYNSTCGYCHGARGKGGQAGPDLIVSNVTLHDEDGVQLAMHVRGAAHSKVAKVEVVDSQMADIAAYLHSRVIGADMLRFHREVNHPNFTLLLDTGHFAGRNGPNGPKIPGTTYDDYYHSIEQVAPLTQFVRAKVYDLDESGREKWIDYDRVFGILRKVNFNGFISMIYEGKEDKFTVIPKAIRLLRSFVMS